ncbi:MAG: phosphate acyltransferase PlsX [bacterium]|nr:phosphate acyltransferase PlsX [bacterium]
MSENTRPMIALDAMGGDHGPSVVVRGAVNALCEDSPFGVVLYGDEAAISAELAQLDADKLPISIVHCTQDIDMGESPASAIRNKKDSPIVRAILDQKQKQVQAVVSAGSTGAMVAGSLILLGRLPGVDRPAIGTLIPTIKGELLLLDAGANVQCTKEHLLSFGRMGVVFAKNILKVDSPTVGQLNIGGEPKKGTELNVETHALLEESDLNFIGNIEGNQFMLGPCDVVVTDGFTGNNTLKLVEGFAHFLHALAQRPGLKDEERAAIKPVLGLLMREFSYEVYGGAMLLGVDGNSIIAHGRSSSLAITNAIKMAWREIEADLPARLAAAHSE